MLKKALAGLWATCVCLTLQPASALAATDVVLHASDASNVHGNWSLTNDATAADGQLLSSTDKGWSSSNAPRVSPADYFDFTFTATANTPYHLWVRLRAGGNAKANDSVYAQFSDALDSTGAAVYGIGTTAALTLTLQTCNACKLSGWGWIDGTFSLSQPATLKFATTGSHTLRIQTREDGVSLDQVVLSPSTYLTTAPGLSTKDMTIVAKPASLPAPWSSQDVGSTGLTGSSSYTSGAFRVVGAGADIWGTADAFHFAYSPLGGDGQIVARVTSQQNADTSGKSGVMMRETTAAGSTDVILHVRPSGSLEFMVRPSTGAATTNLVAITQALPIWLKLIRGGTTITAYKSADGLTWSAIGNTTASMAATIGAGLAVTSHSTSSFNISTFDNVAVTTGAAPPPPPPPAPPAIPTSPTPSAGASAVSTSTSLSWSAGGATSYDVKFGATNPPPQVATGLSTASYTPSGMTAGTTYYWQVVARNAGGTTSGPVWSFATAPQAPAAPNSPSPVSGSTGVATTASLAWSAAGATSYDVSFGTTNPPSLVASALATAAYSPTGLTTGRTYYWRILARNAGGTTTGPVWSFTTGGLPAPWLSQDVGLTGLTGSSTYATGVFTVTGAGADIWGTADAFQFAYAPLSGDGQIVARVATEQNTDTFAKAGVMLRETIAAGSTSVILDVRPNGSLEFMVRPSSGTATTYIAGGTQPTPTWLKLVRGGTTVTAYMSADGLTWSTIGSTTVAMAATIDAGLAVTSHLTSALNTSTFDNVAVTASALLPPAVPTPLTPTAGAAGVSTSASLGWAAAGATSYNVSFGTTNPPPTVATGLTAATYAPSGMTTGTTYYWQVLAQNSMGATGGPVWSFTTVAPGSAPAAPNSPSPISGATSVATIATLTWSGTGATSYDVSFGATNPPGPVVSGLLTASYMVSGMSAGSTYYWRVTARNAFGSTVGPVWSFTTSTSGGSTTWTVNAGGDLQGAINNAQPGDTILLQAGATFTGNFVLPVKSGSSYITIRSSAADAVLPGPNTRINPGYAAQLPKIKSPNSEPALATAASAHHFRLQTLEFLANYQGYGEILALGDGSSLQNTLSMVPHDLIVDRVYVHGDVTYGQKRGIGLNSASTSVINSYIAEIKANGQDSQAICGWNGPGPFTILNNYLEAAGENVMFGGSDASIPNLTPSDITFRLNYLAKQLAWRTQSWQVKNLFELKNAQRVVVDGNVMEYNWQAAQAGYSVLFTPRNDGGTASWTVVQQVQFTNNVVRHVSSAVSILGTDDIHPSQLTNNIVVRNNLFEDVSGVNWGGSGRFVLIQGGAQITIDHNTVLQDGWTALYAGGAQVTGLTFTNNIVPDYSWAIMGDNASPGNGTIAMYFPNAQILDGIFAGAPASSYPTGNYYPTSMSTVGFVSLTNKNYRLATTSIYRGAATDGTDVGTNIDALNAAAGTAY